MAPSPPDFLQRVRRPPLMLAALALAGLLTVAFFLAPGVVALVQATRDGRTNDSAVRCRVLPTTTRPLPPPRPGSVYHELSLELSFAGPGGDGRRAVDCHDDLDLLRPLTITYDPSALGLPAGKDASPQACTTRALDPGAPDLEALTFVNDVGDRRALAVVCPGGATADRRQRIAYHPHDLGLRSRSEIFPPSRSDGSAGDYVVAASLFAIGGFFLGAMAWGWWMTRVVYAVAPVDEVDPDGRPSTPPAPTWEEAIPAPTARPPTTVRPSRLNTVVLATLPGLFFAALGSLYVIGALLNGDRLSASAVGLALVVLVALSAWWLVRRESPRRALITVSDAAITVAKPGAAAEVICRRDTGLVAIEIISGMRYFAVAGIKVWRPDGRMLGTWDLFWPPLRSGRPIRRALGDHGWPQVEQSSRFGDRLFRFDPGRQVTDAD